jgi:hypothetical protein
MTCHGRTGERGQSIVETALVMPLLLLLVLAFAGAAFVLDATVELRSATSLATAASFSAPAGATRQALANVTDTFTRSFHDPFVRLGSLSMSCPPSEGNQYLYAGTHQPGTVVSCHGRATLSFDRSLIGLVWRWPVHLSQDAQLPVPPFRQCAQGVTC